MKISALNLSLALLGATTLSGTFAVPAAHAQAPRRYSNSFPVSGALKLPRRDVPIQSATLNLRREGTFTLVLTGPRAFESSGRWTARGDNARLQFERFNGQSANGDGRVNFRSNGNRALVESLTVNGRYSSGTNDGDRFSGQFSAQDSGVDEDNAGNNGNRTLDSTQSGGGVVRIEGEARDRDVRSARVQLERDGRAVITLDGDRNYVYQGRWTQRDRNTVNVQLPNGDGEITLAGNSFRRIELRGREGGNNFRARFSTNPGEIGRDREPVQGNLPPFNGANGGSGRLEIGREVQAVLGMSAQLSGNGRDATIVVDGDTRDLTLRGEWALGLGGTRYEMRLDGDGVRGQATMTVANGRITQFVFKGKEGNRDVSVRFIGA